MVWNAICYQVIVVQWWRVVYVACVLHSICRTTYSTTQLQGIPPTCSSPRVVKLPLHTDDVIPILFPGVTIHDLSYCVYKCQHPTIEGLRHRCEEGVSEGLTIG